MEIKPLILYFTANYPDKETVTQFIQEIDPEIVKYVEIGIPIENPLYDGPTIKATHSVARTTFKIDDLSYYSKLLLEKGIKTYVLTYYKVIKEGKEKLLDDLYNAGISGVIVPDLLTDFYEISGEVISAIERKIRFVPFFNPATPDAIIKDVVSLTSSWIYYGLLPSTGISVPYDLEEVSNRIVSLIQGREINFGFGIRTVEDVEAIISLGSSGVAIGTMLVSLLKEHDLEGFRRFQSQLREAMVNAN